MERKSSFAVLLVVVAASVIFGMVLGGRLNAPSTMLAATDASWLDQPGSVKATRAAGPVEFADVAETALRAVVAVQNTSIQKASEGEEEQDPHAPLREDPFFRWFFRSPDTERRSVGFGSGFIISPDGYILTNNHVVEGATRLTVELHNGEKFPAEVIGTDPSIDLALIKVDAKGEQLPTLELGDSSALRVGEWVLAIGNPLGLEYTVTVGVVSAKARNFAIGTTLPGVASFIQTDAAINKGNSGGPLLSADGRVVGINTAIFRGGGLDSPLVEGVGFALPINVARDAARQLLETGSVQRGFLGITMNTVPLDEESREYYGLPDTDGVLITEVREGQPAARAGVKAHDIIRAVDGQKVRDNNDLLAKIATRRPGETVHLEVFRGGKTLDLAVKLTSREEGLAAEVPESRPSERDEPVKPAAGLGIAVDELTPALRDRLDLADVQGVIITQVDPASAAADKGISPRMVITGIDDKPIRNVADWNRAVGKLRVGDLVMLEIRLGPQTILVHLKVPEEP
jgi:serine protease Do